MEIEKKVRGWFEDTQQQISGKSTKDSSFSLSFCAVVTPVMKTYCCAAGLLLDKGYNLPTTALLRAISELFIKFLWCVNTSSDQEIRERAKRWEKSTAKEKFRLYENLLKTTDVLSPGEVQKLQEAKVDIKNALKSNTSKCMPAVTGNGSLFEQCSNVFGEDVSGLLYHQFCSAVHINTSILRGLMGAEVNDAGNLVIQDDISEDISGLKERCLNFAFMFLKIVHEKVNLKIDDIEKEYKNISSVFSMTKNKKD